MMKKLMFIAMLLVPVTAHGQRFPYQSADFFRECSHLSQALHGEPPGLLIQDVACARYIEGFEFGYIAGMKNPPTCMADPLTVFRAADALYQLDAVKAKQPEKYLAAVVERGCLK
jgi:hypothetical protein